MKDLKIFKDFYLVILGLKLLCVNLSYKLRDCLLLLVRVFDLKVIKLILGFKFIVLIGDGYK